MNRKLVSTGLLAGLVAGTGAGLILQQTGLAGASNGVAAVAVVDDDTATTDTTATDNTTATTETTATDDTDAARPDRGDRVREVLQPLVDDGTLTAAQLDSVVAALEAAGPVGGGGPRGHGGHGGPGGRGIGLDTAATALGLTTDELRTELEAGSTIAEVAAEQSVEVQTVIDALLAEAESKLSERVTAGDLTQAEADAKLAELTTRITDMVNNGRPERPAAPSADDAADDASAAG